MSNFCWAAQLSLILWNACVALLNFECSNPSKRRGNVTIKIQQKYLRTAWTDSRLACLSSVLYQHLSVILVILYRPYPLSCQLYFVYLAVFLLSVLLDNYCICGTWRPNMKPSEIFEGNQKRMKWVLLIHLTVTGIAFDRYTTDSWPIFRRQSVASASAECRPRYWLRYLPIVGRYVDDHSGDITVDTSVDTSTDISRSLYQPRVGWYVDRH